MDRREFLKGTAWMGAFAAASGCASDPLKLGSGAGGDMNGFATKPMDRVRVGVIGLGARGANAAIRLPTVPGVDVAAICDLRESRVDAVLKSLAAIGKPPPRAYTGGEGWKRLVGDSGVDVVYIVTNWETHAPMSVYAMESGKHAFVEVPAAVTEDECWQLVETAERTRRHCMMLENCNYGDTELLALNLCRHGVLGELVHAECAYIHDLRTKSYSSGESGYWNHWRLKFNQKHKGNAYPTHGLGGLPSAASEVRHALRHGPGPHGSLRQVPDHAPRG